MVFHTTLILVSFVNKNQVHKAPKQALIQLNPGQRVMFSVFENWKFYKVWTGTQWHAKTSPVLLRVRFLAAAGQKTKMTKACHSADIGLHFGVIFERLKKMTHGCSWRATTGSWYILRYNGNRHGGWHADWNCRPHHRLYLLSRFPFPHYPADISLWFCSFD